MCGRPAICVASRFLARPTGDRSRPDSCVCRPSCRATPRPWTVMRRPSSGVAECRASQPRRRPVWTSVPRPIQEVTTTLSRHAQPRAWLRAVSWLVGKARPHPRACATTMAVARDLAKRMDYSEGTVLYDLTGTADRCGVSTATVKRHVRVLRELGAAGMGAARFQAEPAAARPVVHGHGDDLRGYDSRGVRRGGGTPAEWVRVRGTGRRLHRGRAPGGGGRRPPRPQPGCRETRFGRACTPISWAVPPRTET